MKPKLFKYLFAPFMLHADEAGGGGDTIIADEPAVSDPASVNSVEGNEPPPPPVSDVRTYMDQDGKFINPKWAGEGHESIAKKFTSLEALTKSYAHLERQLGNSNKVAIPNENSPQEDWDAYYTGLGRPATPEGYELVRPDTVPEEQWSDEEAKDYSVKAHELGLTKKQTSELAAWQAERVGKGFEANAAEVAKMQQETVTNLKNEWGGDYDANLAAAKRGAMSAGGQELVDHPLAANDPVVIRALAKIGGMLKEDGSSAIRSEGSSLNVGSLDEQIAKIRNDASHPYHHAGHPGHDKAVQTMDGLYQRRNPEKA